MTFYPAPRFVDSVAKQQFMLADPEYFGKLNKSVSKELGEE
jgi:hypothetical protein